MYILSSQMRSLCVQIDTELHTACLGGKISRVFLSTNEFFMSFLEDVTGRYELLFLMIFDS